MAVPRSNAAAQLVLLALLASACTDRSATTAVAVPLSELAVAAAPHALHAPLAREVRGLAAGRGIGRLPMPPAVRPPLAQLGQALAFDPILSGNRDISCMTCHHPELGTGDGRSLSIGQGARGLGVSRVHPDGLFIPRNAPPLYNLHALSTLFWDGRVSGDRSTGFHTPVGRQLTTAMAEILELGAVAAVPLFPVLSREEMRGAVSSGNELAAIPDDDAPAVWAALMRRLRSVPEYRRLFEQAYPGQRVDDMTFAHAANAIAGFFVSQLTFANTPWDRFLAGDDDAMTRKQLAGARTFMALKCSICHGGPALSDNAFHNVAVAQLGPGAGDGTSGRDDFGRFRVSGLPHERYAFRTTPLRNVELTAPYGHSGAISDLREFIAHYSESHLKLRAFDGSALEPLLRSTVLANADEILRTRDPLIDGVVLTDSLVTELVDFMTALTDPAARDPKRVTPKRVPSGLPVLGP